MNKAQLIENIATKSNSSKAEATRILDATIVTISDLLKSGDSLTLVGFGTFSVSKRAARTGRNPATGAALNIPAKSVVKFKSSKNLNDKL